ncbi:uncharacterized protein LOC117802260 isoform X2 [Ailuropoda melanoleuca]|uniref:uncharacterized protein LOC117802260 isoform X2 n=1 Tax=Ailuropoda melanoleuca TaxID=9646 RepID=UPI001494B2D7|nr:uncharacterized protein LOC117802260 isoform X2 [Ailuropoda melanoleuca]
MTSGTRRDRLRLNMESWFLKAGRALPHRPRRLERRWFQPLLKTEDWGPHRLLDTAHPLTASLREKDKTQERSVGAKLWKSFQKMLLSSKPSRRDGAHLNLDRPHVIAGLHRGLVLAFLSDNWGDQRAEKQRCRCGRINFSPGNLASGLRSAGVQHNTRFQKLIRKHHDENSSKTLRGFAGPHYLPGDSSSRQ